MWTRRLSRVNWSTFVSVTGDIDVHQHLWPPAFVERLRARAGRPPYLRDWTLHTAGEPPYEVDPSAHAIDKRLAAEQGDGTALAALALSSPIGVERHDDLLDAWHEGVAELPEPFTAWAGIRLPEPDVSCLEHLLGRGLVGVQVPADAVATPAGWEALGEILRLAERLDKPLLVHPGPAASGVSVPGWWAPVVDYTAQMQAAWWAWHAFGGRTRFPALRLCFAAGAGLAPVHHERLVNRGGRLGAIDPNLYIDTSGYGPQAIDAVTRILGIDQVVHGTDRPYADAVDLMLGDAATAVIRRTNPHRLLFGADPKGVK
jgi:6-methylsalicylate decarboxylase